jgi:hypothetical protein
MEYPSFGPETALALLHALLYSMACILAGAALIALAVYVVLVSSEMFSQPRSKTQCACGAWHNRRAENAEAATLAQREYKRDVDNAWTAAMLAMTHEFGGDGLTAAGAIEFLRIDLRRAEEKYQKRTRFEWPEGKL